MGGAITVTNHSQMSPALLGLLPAVSHGLAPALDVTQRLPVRVQVLRRVPPTWRTE